MLIWFQGMGRRYGIFSKNEYFYWMNNQIIFWMNKFFEWIFLLYYWMNFWMNQKSAIFIRKMNKKCVLSKKRPILHVFFHSFSLFFTVFSSFDFFPIWMKNFIELGKNFWFLILFLSKMSIFIHLGAREWLGLPGPVFGWPSGTREDKLDESESFII